MKRNLSLILLIITCISVGSVIGGCAVAKASDSKKSNEKAGYVDKIKLTDKTTIYVYDDKRHLNTIYAVVDDFRDIVSITAVENHYDSGGN